MPGIGDVTGITEMQLLPESAQGARLERLIRNPRRTAKPTENDPAQLWSYEAVCNWRGVGPKGIGALGDRGPRWVRASRSTSGGDGAAPADCSVLPHDVFSARSGSRHEFAFDLNRNGPPARKSNVPLARGFQHGGTFFKSRVSPLPGMLQSFPSLCYKKCPFR
jgi:hypothetical protein